MQETLIIGDGGPNPSDIPWTTPAYRIYQYGFMRVLLKFQERVGRGHASSIGHTCLDLNMFPFVFDLNVS
jgi:hypothetical protein